ncbi:MAG: hypothetical protein ACYSUC_02310 [Planctomycetota bacterium]|jgi:hypothetical protein
MQAVHTPIPKVYLRGSFRCVAEGEGRRQGNEEIIEWVWSVIAQGATSVRIIEKINDNKFILNHEYILPDGSKMEDKADRQKELEKPLTCATWFVACAVGS